MRNLIFNKLKISCCMTNHTIWTLHSASAKSDQCLHSMLLHADKKDSCQSGWAEPSL